MHIAGAFLLLAWSVKDYAYAQQGNCCPYNHPYPEQNHQICKPTAEKVQ